MDEETIRRGVRELESGQRLEPGRVRRGGGGRKPLTQTDPTLVGDLQALVDPESRGDPCRPLRWTAKSVRHLADALAERGHRIHFTSVAKLLRHLGYSLQANSKTREGSSHPDRDAQFIHINERVATALLAGEPAISVDTKKKELVGDFKAVGRELRPKGSPIPVRVHDFKDPILGKAIPYGVYDLADDTGWVNLGIDNDTAQFAVASIRGWWEHLGAGALPECHHPHDHRRLRWLQRLPHALVENGTAVPGRPDRPADPRPALSPRHQQVEQNRTSPVLIHHSELARQTPGEPPGDHQLDRATTTRTGLEVYAQLDERLYPKAITITDDQLAVVQIEGDAFHPERNYTIKPLRC